MRKLLCSLLMLGSVCLAQSTRQASDNMIVVGNSSQPVQWVHRSDIQTAINAAANDGIGVVWIPPTYGGNDCNPISACNPGNILVIDLRGGMFQTVPTITGSSLLNTANLWSATQTFASDIRFTPVGGPNFYYNRGISTSNNAPLNGCQQCFGPTDPIVYGCVSCDVSKTSTGFTSSNGLINMNLARGNGSSGPAKLCDYLGCLLGFGPAGSQMVSSNQTGNSDLDGELTQSSNSSTYTFVNTYTVHPICTANDETAIAAVKVTYTGVASVTFTTSGASDVVGYICNGRK